MKRKFGSWFLRTFRGGVALTEGEQQLLSSLVAELPPHLRESAEGQFAEYNLVQREADGRALNFYKVGLLSRTPLPVSPLPQSNPKRRHSSGLQCMRARQSRCMQFSRQ